MNYEISMNYFLKLRSSEISMSLQVLVNLWCRCNNLELYQNVDQRETLEVTIQTQMKCESDIYDHNKHIRHNDLSRGSAKPQRKAYVPVVKVTTKIESLFTSYTSLQSSTNDTWEIH